MNDDVRVRQLVEEILESQRTPEEVCAGTPDLLPVVRQRLEQVRRTDNQLDEMFGDEGPIRRGATTPLNGEIESPVIDGYEIESILGRGGMAKPPLPEVPGYEILGVLGEGGMGIVYRGRDPKFNRVVAIKLIREKHRQRPDAVARFLEEAKITGLLQNPGVPPVYDLGKLPDGGPFFSIKLVQGQTLWELLEARKCPADDLPRFLDVFAQVCHTLAYAHSHRVIHRDLKPHNVMVGKFAEVQVMDWGMAKVLGQAETPVGADESAALLRAVRSGAQVPVSELGDVLGTPSFMPPEQAIGEIDQLDERSDVFGLGAILCVILTGKPPYGGQDSWEIHRKAIRGDLSDAFARLDGCGADEELIALAKACLAPEKNHRPANAGAVAERVAAYQASVQQRLEREKLERAAAQLKAVEERRRRRVTVGLAVSIVAVLVVAAGGAWAWEQQRTLRQQNRENVESSLARLDELFRTWQWTEAEKLLERTEALLGPDGDSELRDRVAKAKRKTRLFHDLDKARLIKGESVEREFNFARASAQYAKAFSTFGLDVRPGQAEILAPRIREEEPAVREALLVALDDWAFCDRTEFAANLRGLAAAADDDEWRQEYRKAVGAKDGAAFARISEQARRLQLTPRSLVLLALRLRDRNKRAEAVALLRWARSQHPADFWIAFDLGNLLDTRGGTPADLEEKTGCYRVAVAIRPQSSAAHNNLGNALRDKKQLDDAIAEYKIAIRLDPKTAAAHINLGNALTDKKQLDDAIAEFKIAIQLDRDLAQAHNNLGVALSDKKQLDDAIAEYRIAIQLKPKVASTHTNLGNALHAKGQLDDAISEYKTASQLDPKFAPAHHSLGVALSAKKQLDDAIAEYKIAIQLDPKDASTHTNLGNALSAKKQLDDAIAEYKIAIELDPKYLPAHNNLGKAFYAKKHFDDAIAEFRIAIVLEPRFVHAHGALGQALLQMGRLGEAKTSTQNALKLLPENHPLRPIALRQLQQCDAMLALEAKVPDIVAGKAKPADNRERRALIDLCHIQQRNTAAAKLSAGAFTDDPKLADNMKAGHRYNAACYAALAAAGKGIDADKLDDQERVRLRQQALEWLRTDLAHWRGKAASGKEADRAQVQQTLKHWEENTDLVAIRDKDTVAKLPAEERAVCAKLWAEVAELLAKAGEKK